MDLLALAATTEFGELPLTDVMTTPVVTVSEDETTLYTASMSGDIIAFSADQGKRLWKRQTGGPVRATPLLDPEGRLYVGSRDHHLYALSAADGEILWRVNLGSEIDANVVVYAPGALVVGCDDGGVYFLEVGS